MAKITIKNLTKSFNNIMCLDNISLEIEHNEITVIVGPSGCGKTTLMRCIVGFETPDKGNIYIDGEDVAPLRPKDRNIAMVFQYYSLYPNMNVRKNLSIALEHTTQLSKEEIHYRVEDIAKILGITRLLDRKPSQLSGGEAQRVAIGRALIRNPKIIFLDEPLSAVDAKMRRELRAEIRKILKRFEVTAIYVTHDQEEAMALADKMVMLGDGHICDIGTPEQLYKNPRTKYTAGLIGKPPMNFFICKVTNKDGIKHLVGRDIDIKISQKLFEKHLAEYLNKDIIIGIRPSDFYLTNNQPNNDSSFVCGTVDNIDNLGDEMHIYLSKNKLKFVANTALNKDIHLGRNLCFSFNEESIYLFDYENECNIAYAEN